jgi:DNA-binding FadR family transcriptional regulator
MSGRPGRVEAGSAKATPVVDRADRDGSVANRLPDVSPKPKLAQRVARRIEAEIIAAGWPIGEVLGSEADLLERYEVSRAVLREAVRLLEGDSVARMRRGPGGGLVVTAPEPTSVVRAMAVNLNFMGATPTNLLEAREALELTSVTLATERLDEAGIGALREAIRAEADAQEHDHRLATYDVHLVIAELTGNPAIRLFMEVLANLTTMLLPKSSTVGGPAGATVHNVHERIVEAMIAGDGGLARHRMSRHLSAMGDWLG